MSVPRPAGNKPSCRREDGEHHWSIQSSTGLTLKSSTMPASSLNALPAELLSLILVHARHHDCQARDAEGRYSLQQQRQQQAEHHASSVLQLSRSCRRLYSASMPVLYETIDITRVKAIHRLSLLHQLSQPAYGRFVRSLSVKVALGSAHLQEALMAYRQQLLLDHNDALSIEQTVSLLDSLPYLTSLDLELVNVLPGSYVSRLPLALATALRRNGRHVSHFGIKCCQLKTLESLQEEDKLPIPIHAAESETDSTVTTACPYFQLDECLIADAILSFPSLQSLSLSEVTYDTLSTYSPLFEAASSLAQLREVEISDTSGLNERWTRKALSSPLRSLRFISTGAGVSSPVQIS